MTDNYLPKSIKETVALLGAVMSDSDLPDDGHVKLFILPTYDADDMAIATVDTRAVVVQASNIVGSYAVGIKYPDDSLSILLWNGDDTVTMGLDGAGSPSYSGNKLEETVASMMSVYPVAYALKNELQHLHGHDLRRALRVISITNTATGTRPLSTFAAILWALSERYDVDLDVREVVESMADYEPSYPSDEEIYAITGLLGGGSFFE